MKVIVMILLLAPIYLFGDAFDSMDGSDGWGGSTTTNSKSYLYYDVNYQDQMKAYLTYLDTKQLQRKQEEDIYLSGKRRSRDKAELKKMAAEEKDMNQDKTLKDEELLKLEREALKKMNKQ